MNRRWNVRLRLRLRFGGDPREGCDSSRFGRGAFQIDRDEEGNGDGGGNGDVGVFGTICILSLGRGVEGMEGIWCGKSWV